MNVVEIKTSSRRHLSGGGGFGAEKSRQKVRLVKGGERRRFRLIVSAPRDKRGKMISVRKRHDCEEVETRLLDGREVSEHGLA